MIARQDGMTALLRAPGMSCPGMHGLGRLGLVAMYDG